MNYVLKNHLFILLFYAAAVMISTMFGMSLIGTLCNALCNAVFGAENAGESGTVLYQFVMAVLRPLIAMCFIHMRRARNREEYRAFKTKLAQKPYSGREDYEELKKNRDLWEEVVFVAILTVLYWLFDFFNFWILLNIPFFIGFQFFSHLRIHHIWAHGEL